LDSLTKLPNRRAFQQHIDSAAKRSGRAGTTFALAYIDLDHFKPINDQHGHHVGDIVLSKVADRLNASVRGCDFVARIGGDEFVAIIEEIKSNDDISPIVARIVSSVKEPFVIDQLSVEISCSVGIAIYPQDGDLEKLMVCADAAMYKAKEGGKNQYKYYDTDIEQASEELLALQSELCLAIENNEFTLAYQPKIDCQTNLPIGAEALIRWNHPTKGELPPKAFIQAAERFGLINEINSWVVDECCRTIAEAKRAGFKLNFSVNLSSHQFRNPNLVKDILKTLKFYDLDASSLSFEIKETLAINNQSQFKEILEKFSEAGINVVLDDFGLHPISLAYLQNLHVSEIKLDKSFINNITQDKNSKALIDAVIKLAHALDLQVVAEGVETELQRDIIVALGCDYMQGYLFSKAIAAEQLFKLYAHLHNRQFQLGFETSGQLLVSDYQLGEVA
jgi:diguanylate cyclase (GGDEF)-like protein